MFHQHPADWEVVDSYSVEPIQLVYERAGVKIRKLAPHEISGSYTFDMHARRDGSPSPSRALGGHKPKSGRTSPPATPKTLTASQTPVQPEFPQEIMQKESEHHSSPAFFTPKKLHRRSHSAAAPATSAVSKASNPFGIASSIFRRTSSPDTTPVAQVQGPEKHEKSLVASGSPVRTSTSSTPLSRLNIFNYSRRLSAESSLSSASGTSNGDAKENVEPVAIVPEERTPRTRHTRTTSQVVGSPCLSSPQSPPPAMLEHTFDKKQVKRVLKFARAQMIQEVSKSGYNMLVLEGWDVTILRQGTRYRYQVNYRSRPALVEGLDDNSERPRSPPFLEVLDR